MQAAKHNEEIEETVNDHHAVGLTLARLQGIVLELESIKVDPMSSVDTADLSDAIGLMIKLLKARGEIVWTAELDEATREN